MAILPTPLPLVVLCSLSAPPTLAAPQSFVQDLGAPAGTQAYPYGTNSDGSVVVGAFGPSLGPTLPFVWTEPDGFQPLDTLGDGIGEATDVSHDGLWATGTTGLGRWIRWNLVTGAAADLAAPDFATNAYISGDGSAAVATLLTPQGGRPAHWSSSGGLNLIGTLGGDTYAKGLSRDGGTVVGLSYDASGTSRAFRWTASTGLQVPTGMPSGAHAADAVSADGRALSGLFTTSQQGRRAFRWTVAAGFEDLGTLGGNNATAPTQISADGSKVTGMDRQGSPGGRAFRWSSSTGMVALDTTSFAQPLGISDDGAVIAGTWRPAGSSSVDNFHWTQSTGMRSLDDLGLDSCQAFDLSADGSTLVGYSLSKQGVRAARWRASGEIGLAYCPPTNPNSTGGQGSLTLKGSNSVALGSLVLEAAELPPGAFCLFLVSDDVGVTSPFMGSMGTLCLGSTFAGFQGPGEVQRVGPSGVLTQTVDPSSLPGQGGTWTPSFGQSVYFQAWYRDANPGATTNLTNGATVRFY